MSRGGAAGAGRAGQSQGTAAGGGRAGQSQGPNRLAEGQPLLEARDVRKRYGGLVALDGLDFHVNPGEVVGLIGPKDRKSVV